MTRLYLTEKEPVNNLLGKAIGQSPYLEQQNYAGQFPILRLPKIRP